MCLLAILPSDNERDKGQNLGELQQDISMATVTGLDLGACLKGTPSEVLTNFLTKPGNT